MPTCSVTGKAYILNNEDDKKMAQIMPTIGRKVFDPRAKDGKIPVANVYEAYKELTKALVEAGVRSKDEVDDAVVNNTEMFNEILKEADANGDGFFEFDEFMTIGSRVGAKFMDRELKKFDLDGDGYITTQERDATIAKMKAEGHPHAARFEAALKMIFDNFDHDGDGKINYDEWQKASKVMRW